MSDIFIQFSIIILIVLGVSFIMRLLRQPLIIGYIIAGVVVGFISSMYFLDISAENPILGIFSHFGIAFLLFVVGIHLNPKILKEIGLTSLIAGLVQIVFTFVAGFFISTALGFNTITSVYVGIALTFSSTIIIMKLLSDKGELETLYGKMAIGVLILQDFVAIFILMAISATSSVDIGGFSLLSVIYALIVILLLFLSSFTFLPKLVNFVAQSQELLFLFSITWCFVIASIFDYLGFSIHIGALLAGMALSMNRYDIEISAKVRPLRDFFLVVFFVLLGLQVFHGLFQGNLGSMLFQAGILSLFIFVGHPLIMLIIMGALGYRKRTSFLAGTAMAQISEFGIIIIELGIIAGHVNVNQGILPLIILVGIITMTGSTYLISYGSRIYPKISNLLSIFERKGKLRDDKTKDKDYDILLFGYNRMGFNLLNSLKKGNQNYLVIDFNPETISKLRFLGVECLYGDAQDTELLDDLKISGIKMAISTIPDIESNLLMTDYIRQRNKGAVILVVSHHISDAFKLYEAGASYVLMPHFLGGERAASMLDSFGTDINKYEAQKIKHLQQLKERLEEGHEHPHVERDKK